MTRTPSKNEVFRILEDVEEAIPRLRNEVKWASDLGFTPKVRPAEQVSKTGHGDSTGSTAIGQELTRAQVKKVYAWVAKLGEVAKRIDSELGYLFEKADHRKDYEQEAPTGEHGRHPVRGALVTRAELERARHAKDRRTNRGEGYGAS